MLGLSENYFKAGTIKILEQLIINSHKTNEKIKFQQGKGVTKNENHRAEKYYHWTEDSVEGFNNSLDQME